MLYPSITYSTYMHVQRYRIVFDQSNTLTIRLARLATGLTEAQLHLPDGGPQPLHGPALNSVELQLQDGLQGRRDALHTCQVVWPRDTVGAAMKEKDRGRQPGQQSSDLLGVWLNKLTTFNNHCFNNY